MTRLLALLLVALCCWSLQARAAFLPGGICTSGASQVVVSSATLTSATKIITGAATKQTYICSIVGTAPNNNVALIEGTGTNCGTGTELFGTTGTSGAANNGFNFNNATAPGVGLTVSPGPGPAMVSATAGDDTCVIAASGTQVTLYIFYTQQ